MGCKVHLGVDGKVMAITCSRGRPQPCSVPGCDRPHTKLCDFPVLRNGKKATCDAALCGTHAVKKGKDIDHCPPHSTLEPSR